MQIDSSGSSHYSVEKLYIFSHSLDDKLLADSCFLSSYVSIGLSMLYIFLMKLALKIIILKL